MSAHGKHPRSGRPVARRMWQLLEPYHAVVYFAPDARASFEAVGLKGYWMGYFASRSAALGAVPAEVVIASFYNFHPRMVRRALPDAWRMSTPAQVLAARYALADRTLRALLGEMTDGEEVRRAAELASRAAAACDPAGRPLFAAHASLDAPDTPHLALWHAATLLREHRGDGHVAALLTHGLDGCEAHVLMAIEGRVDPIRQRDVRGWTDEEWAAAEERLRARGLLDGKGRTTSEGAALRARVEQLTDALAEPPYAALGAEAVEELGALLEPLRARILAGDAIPFPNPMGLPADEVQA